MFALQRLLELGWSRRNARWLRRQGGYEVGREHYPMIVAVHLLFFLGIAMETSGFRTAPPEWWPLPLALFAVAQLVRIWCMVALGPYWNTRVFVVPGHPLRKTGLYRWLRHPNYAAVLMEMISFPLLFGAYVTAVAGVAVKWLVLRFVRIPVEEAGFRQRMEATREAEEKQLVKS
jgi:methyltransferase